MTSLAPLSCPLSQSTDPANHLKQLAEQAKDAAASIVNSDHANSRSNQHPTGIEPNFTTGSAIDPECIASGPQDEFDVAIRNAEAGITHGEASEYLFPLANDTEAPVQYAPDNQVGGDQSVLLLKPGTSPRMSITYRPDEHLSGTAQPSETLKEEERKIETASNADPSKSERYVQMGQRSSETVKRKVVDTSSKVPEVVTSFKRPVKPFLPRSVTNLQKEEVQAVRRVRSKAEPAAARREALSSKQTVGSAAIDTPSHRKPSAATSTNVEGKARQSESTGAQSQTNKRDPLDSFALQQALADVHKQKSKLAFKRDERADISVRAQAEKVSLPEPVFTQVESVPVINLEQDTGDGKEVTTLDEDLLHDAFGNVAVQVAPDRVALDATQAPALPETNEVIGSAAVQQAIVEAHEKPIQGEDGGTVPGPRIVTSADVRKKDISFRDIQVKPDWSDFPRVEMTPGCIINSKGEAVKVVDEQLHLDLGETLIDGTGRVWNKRGLVTPGSQGLYPVDIEQIKRLNSGKMPWIGVVPRSPAESFVSSRRSTERDSSDDAETLDSEDSQAEADGPEERNEAVHPSILEQPQDLGRRSADEETSVIGLDSPRLTLPVTPSSASSLATPGTLDQNVNPYFDINSTVPATVAFPPPPASRTRIPRTPLGASPAGSIFDVREEPEEADSLAGAISEAVSVETAWSNSSSDGSRASHETARRRESRAEKWEARKKVRLKTTKKSDPE